MRKNMEFTGEEEMHDLCLRQRISQLSDYRRATGFEALIGHLYLTGQYERLTELVSDRT